jgi:hypothetical protein
LILTIAILFGLLAGQGRAWRRKTPYQIPELRSIWLVLLAFVPQYLIFTLPATREGTPDGWASIIHMGSQIPLLIFIWQNWRVPGFQVLGLGLALNAAVIFLNGGFMPISPATATRLFSNDAALLFEHGERLMTSKNIVLMPEYTRLEWLADRFFIPLPFNYRAALSLGDFFIAGGAFLALFIQKNTSE